MSEESGKAFGPSAIATPANALTLGRLVVSPLFALLVGAIGSTSWLLWALWCVLVLSDGLDGYVARWHGTTRSGAFLDPLADKFLVLGALAALAVVGTFAWLPVALIAFREVAMSAYRFRAGRRGVSVPARRLAKAKTVVQDLAVGLAILPPLGTAHPSAARTTLWVAVALTLVSGIEYVLDARRQLRGARPGTARVLTGGSPR
ncbi:MAG TPA: CDP-diacylglycerol--glycerol-3-phosphate 3-phosphatidyltransferase [Acidimicrobiales bacterium]|jgi:CDP-diacylglycerol--glycerol-3-phosphate 3-phosphatidyltransferase|nr:CDP-diacylglycerol--glycerol-3-phosphate 3-phosphatidyltransferase [Acidimicrobiales bacterium]